MPIEVLNTKSVYEILTEKRNKIRNYTPNTAHKHIHKIHQYLTPEERNYWWRLNHNLISIKKTEAKFKRDKEGNLSTPICPICKISEESRDHYNYDCNQVTIFRKIIANQTGKEDFTKEEWMLQKEPSKTATTILIAKSRWIFHCERCNVDHRKKKRINHKTALQKTNKRMTIITNNFEEIRKQTEEITTLTHNNNNRQES